MRTAILTFILTLGAVTMAQANETKTAILAGGCFWCIEHDVEKLDGVQDVVSGYSGGTLPNPVYGNYNKPSDDYTPHVEVIQVTYDPSVLSYDALLDYYFRHIDPTDDGGQFCDRGASYRPVIYYGDEAEKEKAEAASKRAEGVIGETVKVDILPATQFWLAEGYHQNYAKTNTVRYKFYRWRCGRDARIDKLWGSSKAEKFRDNFN